MTRLAICSLFVVISVVASACATQQRVAGRSSQDIHDEIQNTAAYMNRDIVGGTPAGPN